MTAPFTVTTWGPERSMRFQAFSASEAYDLVLSKAVSLAAGDGDGRSGQRDQPRRAEPVGRPASRLVVNVSLAPAFDRAAASASQ